MLLFELKNKYIHTYYTKLHVPKLWFIHQFRKEMKTIDIEEITPEADVRHEWWKIDNRENFSYLRKESVDQEDLANGYFPVTTYYYSESIKDKIRKQKIAIKSKEKNEENKEKVEIKK